ncbi:MAG: M23 family metallopeptidase [Magnetococcales bacterium]|nr:M23 family metallopeptidase [Magnetococcales bacterium]
MALGGAAESAAAPGIELSQPLARGGAAWIQVRELPPGSRVTGGELAGEAFPLTPQGRGLIALDMEAETGPIPLSVRIASPRGPESVIRQTLNVPARSYQEEHLTLPEKKVALNPKDLARSQKETAAILNAYKARGGVPGYLEGFRLPVQGRQSGFFGSRRILNGKPKSPHNGIDVAAPQGTPVVTTAPGVVVLLGKEYFFTGNTVVVHHGDGIFSLYSHLHSVTVREGQKLAAGEALGTVGKTGRATGPHLHWGVRVREARVDPLALPGVEPPAGAGNPNNGGAGR